MKLMNIVFAVMLSTLAFNSYANEELEAGAAAGDGGLSLAMQSLIGVGSAVVLTGVVVSESDNDDSNATTGTTN